MEELFVQVSVHCNGRTIFAREQQASVFKAAYEELPVRLTTLRSFGNFEVALLDAGCVGKVPGIQKPRSFELEKKGLNAVAVGMKEYMHSPRYSSLTIVGVFEGIAPSTFKGGIPVVENGPPFELKSIDSEVIRLIKMLYKAICSRVDAPFPCDKDFARSNQGRDGLFSQSTVSATGSCDFNLPTWWLPDRDGTRTMEGVKTETVQPRSLLGRPQWTKVFVKFTCTGGRNAKQASEMTLPGIEWLSTVITRLRLTTTSLLRASGGRRGVGLRTQTGRQSVMCLCRVRK